MAPAAMAGGAATAEAGKRLNKLERGLERVVELPEGPPGASALVQRRGNLTFLRAGVSNVDSGRAIRRNDHMRIASTSKAFSGAVALSLVDQGTLSLDDTIARRLPGLPAAWGAVTLAQLLQHTSGVPSYTKSPDYLEFLSMNLDASVTPEFLLSFVADEPLEFTPGSEYEYSNSDNIVIGLMAEAASGRSYEELLGDLVLSPLRLRRTSLPSGLEMPRPYVRGYEVEPPAPPEDVSEAISPTELWAAGGMVSTPADLNRFIRAYSSGRLIEKRTRRRQRNFIHGAAGEPPGPGRNSGGLALNRYRTNCGTVLGHTGNFLGYTQFMAVTPHGRRSAVVSANTQLAADTKPETFKHLRRAFRLAACAALPR